MLRRIEDNKKGFVTQFRLHSVSEEEAVTVLVAGLANLKLTVTRKEICKISRLDECFDYDCEGQVFYVECPYKDHLEGFSLAIKVHSFFEAQYGAQTIDSGEFVVYIYLSCSSSLSACQDVNKNLILNLFQSSFSTKIEEYNSDSSKLKEIEIFEKDILFLKDVETVKYLNKLKPESYLDQENV